MMMKIDAGRHATWRVALLAFVATVALYVWAGSAAAASLGQVTEFSAGLQGKASNPTGIAAGPDGNVWFTDQGCALASNPGTCAIGRITPSGAIAEFSAGLQAANKSVPYDIALGPDGNLWFTDDGLKHAIGLITPGGVITEFSAGLQAGNKSVPRFIARGPDGNLWFTDWGCVPPLSGACAIGRITPTGAITEFSAGLQAGNKSFPLGIAAGPDGNLWFTDIGCAIGGACEIGRITPSGTIKEFTAGLQSNSVPGFIATGPDGNLWFTDVGAPPNGTPAIGRITPCTPLPCTPAPIREFSTGLQAGKGSYPYAIASGPDGNMWFTDEGASGPGHGINEIGWITPSGAITESSAGLPTGTLPQGVATGPDGNLWFADGGARAIGQLASRAPAVSTGSASGVTGSGASVAGTVNPLGGAVSAISVQYGPTTTYGSTVASTPATLPPGGTPVAVSATISGLPPEAVIHYRVVATNGVGTAAGVDRAFTTQSVAPRVSGARRSSSRWREGGRRKKKPPIGTTFSFTLNEQASVRFLFTQIATGRRVKGRCVAKTKKNHAKPVCRLIVSRGTLSFIGHSGTNKVFFRGRLSGSKKLRPGRYTLVIVASVAGRSSAPVRLRFTIVTR
jgi:streptogramin lyase